MQVVPEKEERFHFWLEKNGGISSRSSFAYAVEWANELEKLIQSPSSAKSIIWENAEAVGRYVAIKYQIQPSNGYAVNILSQYWQYGETLRDWYNNQSNSL